MLPDANVLNDDGMSPANIIYSTSKQFPLNFQQSKTSHSTFLAKYHAILLYVHA